VILWRRLAQAQFQNQRQYQAGQAKDYESVSPAKGIHDEPPDDHPAQSTERQAQSEQGKSGGPLRGGEIVADQRMGCGQAARFPYANPHPECDELCEVGSHPT